MKKDSKTQCKLTLEEEYAFEHRQRIKAESYISEIWEMNQELTNEVMRLQKEIGKLTPLNKDKTPLIAEIELQERIDNIEEDRKACYENFGKIIKESLR